MCTLARACVSCVCVRAFVCTYPGVSSGEVGRELSTEAGLDSPGNVNTDPGDALDPDLDRERERDLERERLRYLRRRRTCFW
jgi:hypothetical protein